MDNTSLTGHLHDAAAERSFRFIPPSRAHPAWELPAPFPELLDQLIYATVDDCQQCQPALLDRVAGDARATLELVAWACFITSEIYCGIPSELVAGNEASDAPFRASPTFRTLARQYGAHGRIQDTACIHRQQHSAAKRRTPLSPSSPACPGGRRTSSTSDPWPPRLLSGQEDKRRRDESPPHPRCRPASRAAARSNGRRRADTSLMAIFVLQPHTL